MTNNDFIYLDKEGYENHLTKIDNLNINLEKVIAEMNKMTVKDYSNEEYNQLKMLKNQLKDRIYEMREQLTRIVIVEATEENDTIINIGDIVKLKTYFSDNDVEEELYELVADENDFKCQIPKLSVNSPLGKAIYKQSVRSDVYYECVNEKIKVNIVEKTKMKSYRLTNTDSDSENR